MHGGVERMVARAALKELKASVLHEEPLMRRSLRSATAGICLLLGAAGTCVDGYQSLWRTCGGGRGMAGGMCGEWFPLTITTLSCSFPPSLFFLFSFLTQECNPG